MQVITSLTRVVQRAGLNARYLVGSKPKVITCMLCGDSRKVSAGSDAFLCKHCERYHF